MDVDTKEIGHWHLTAVVESRPQDRYVSDNVPIEAGDILFRIVLRLEYNDDSGENGLHGELSTAWLYSLDEAAKQATLLRNVDLTWYEWDDTAEDYVAREGSSDFGEVVAKAIKRYEAAFGNVKSA